MPRTSFGLKKYVIRLINKVTLAVANVTGRRAERVIRSSALMAVRLKYFNGGNLTLVVNEVHWRLIHHRHQLTGTEIRITE